MRFMIKHTPKDEVLATPPEEMQDLIIDHLEYLIGLEDEGKVVDSGAFAGLRGGFLVMEAESIEELDGMLSRAPGMPFLNTEVYPLVDLRTRLERLRRRRERMLQEGGAQDLSEVPAEKVLGRG